MVLVRINGRHSADMGSQTTRPQAILRLATTTRAELHGTTAIADSAVLQEAGAFPEAVTVGGVSKPAGGYPAAYMKPSETKRQNLKQEVLVWGSFSQAGTNLELEANEVGDLSRMSAVMPDPLRGNIRTALMEYLTSVMDDEFPAMSEGRSSQRTWNAVEKLWGVYDTASLTAPKCSSAMKNHSDT